MISTYPHSEHYITLKATIPVSVTPKVKVKKFRATETFIYLFNNVFSNSDYRALKWQDD